MNTKPFVCTLEGCGETFTLLFDWTRHVRKHAASRYQCSIHVVGQLSFLECSANDSTRPDDTPRRPVALPSLGSRTSPVPPTPKAPMALPLLGPSRNQYKTPTSLLPIRSPLPIAPSGASELPALPAPGDTNASAKGSHANAKQSRPESPGGKGRTTKKSDSRTEPSTPSSLRRLLPQPSPTHSEEAASSPILPPPPTPTLSSKVATPEAPQEEAMNADPSPQEVRLDTDEKEDEKQAHPPTPPPPPPPAPATNIDELASTTSVLQSTTLAPPSPPVLPTTMEVDQVEDEPKEQPVVENFGQEIEIEMDTAEAVDTTETMDATEVFDEAVEVEPLKEPSVEDSKDQIEMLHSCAIKEQASKWPKVKAKPRGKKDKKQPTMECNSIFETSTEEIAHYLEHFTATGPYLECPVPTCRMVFVLDSQLKEHGALHDQPPMMSQTASATIPISKPVSAAPIKTGKQQRPKSTPAKSRLTRSQVRTPRSGPSIKKKDNSDIDPDVPPKSLGSSKK
ncbi:MAG: hypothetical protein J3Q66DRAFT_109509 [Benniella sp.]|nr:MAG: hypothetical protein J3Q66DRAFT_109509 [Benniella sp.]